MAKSLAEQNSMKLWNKVSKPAVAREEKDGAQEREKSVAVVVVVLVVVVVVVFDSHPRHFFF